MGAGAGLAGSGVGAGFGGRFSFTGDTGRCDDLWAAGDSAALSAGLGAWAAARRSASAFAAGEADAGGVAGAGTTGADLASATTEAVGAWWGCATTAPVAAAALMPLGASDVGAESARERCSRLGVVGRSENPRLQPGTASGVGFTAGGAGVLLLTTGGGANA